MTGAVEEGWQRGFPLLELDTEAIAALIGQPVLKAEVLTGGRRNTNYRLELTSGPVVLRFYTAEAAACQRDVLLLQLVRDTVPVPRLLQSQPAADPPWAVFEFVEGTRFDHLPPEELPEAAFDAGQVLARIHDFAFPHGGFFGPDLQVQGGSLGPGLVPMLEEWLLRGRAGQRLGPDLTSRLVTLLRTEGSRLAPELKEARLQHADYKSWNLLVRDGRIVAVLDWEFAFAGPRLNDIGIFLRYSERQPPAFEDGFVRGYLAAGGQLPPDWRRLARLQDLISLCWFLEQPVEDPVKIRDVTPLIERTIELFTP